MGNSSKKKNIVPPFIFCHRCNK